MTVSFEQINKSDSIWVRFAPLLIFLFSVGSFLSIRRWTSWQRSWTERRSEVEAVAVEMIQTWGGRRKKTGSCSWSFVLRGRNSTAPSSNTREKSTTCKQYDQYSVSEECHTAPQAARILVSYSVYFLQQWADESQVRVELQMALDSKDSDIEQLRGLLNSLNVQSLDSASMSSGPDMDTDESLPGTVKVFSKLLFILLSLSILS